MELSYTHYFSNIQKSDEVTGIGTCSGLVHDIPPKEVLFGDLKVTEDIIPY